MELEIFHCHVSLPECNLDHKYDQGTFEVNQFACNTDIFKVPNNWSNEPPQKTPIDSGKVNGTYKKSPGEFLLPKICLDKRLKLNWIPFEWLQFTMNKIILKVVVSAPHFFSIYWFGSDRKTKIDQTKAWMKYSDSLGASFLEFLMGPGGWYCPGIRMTIIFSQKVYIKKSDNKETLMKNRTFLRTKKAFSMMKFGGKPRNPSAR